jgi:hypothetical protein
MNHKTEEYWGTVLLNMALESRREGDLVTAELLGAHAMHYLDEIGSLASRWRTFELRLDDQWRGTPVTRH